MKNYGDTSMQLGWRQAIAQRIRDSEIERQLLHHHTALLGEFLKTLLGSVISLWGLVWLLRWAFDLDATLTYAGFGLLFSLQATYYKLRLMRDPTFKIPKCRCAGRSHDNSEAVLSHGRSNVVGVPISALAAALYVEIVLLWLGELRAAALALTAAALLFSAYLGFVMITRIRDLCATCINIAAVNILLACSVF